ncbi:MAG: hypothetical protein V4719_21335 [Planctomycetota bacterium]
MPATQSPTRFEELRPNDHIEITQRIKVGLKIWYQKTTGRVLKIDRRRNGLHVDRNNDDKAFQDIILLLKDGTPSEETTVTMDEYTVIEKLA